MVVTKGIMVTFLQVFVTKIKMPGVAPNNGRLDRSPNLLENALAPSPLGNALVPSLPGNIPCLSRPLANDRDLNLQRSIHTLNRHESVLLLNRQGNVLSLNHQRDGLDLPESTQGHQEDALEARGGVFHLVVHHLTEEALPCMHPNEGLRPDGKHVPSFSVNILFI